jgi:hypothetical protein
MNGHQGVCVELFVCFWPGTYGSTVRHPLQWDRGKGGILSFRLGACPEGNLAWKWFVDCFPRATRTARCRISIPVPVYLITPHVVL